MRCVETLIERWRGMWGDHAVEAAYSTVTRTWFSRDGSHQRSHDSFRLTFLLEGGRTDRREFDSEAEREAFVRSGVHGRSGSEVPLDLLGCQDGFGSLVGAVLHSAELFEDFLRLDLGGPMEILEWPHLHADETVLHHGDLGYGESLRALVGQRVVEADVYLDDGAVIKFESAELRVSPTQIRESTWPEIFDGVVHVGAGEPPFDL